MNRSPYRIRADTITGRTGTHPCKHPLPQAVLGEGDASRSDAGGEGYPTTSHATPAYLVPAKRARRPRRAAVRASASVSAVCVTVPRTR